MHDSLPIVSDFILTYSRNWKKNFSFEINARVDSALYFVIRGKLIFEGEFGKKICDVNNPMYIPERLKYVYRAETDTEAYIFNFTDENPYSVPLTLNPVDIKEIESVHEQLKLLKAVPSMRNKAKIFSHLYRLISLSFPDGKTTQDTVLLPALEYVARNFDNPLLSLDMLAKECHISKVYLHKLFVKILNITPYRYITNVRMEHANILLKDKKTVGQVAMEVGYNDIYTFSRAYKRYYHESPEKTKKN